MRKTSIEVQSRVIRDAQIVDVQGEVDLFSSPKMRSAIMDAINRKEVRQVAVNLSGVNYIDSSGVATLVEGLQFARSRNCRFVLFGLQRAAREVLELALLDKIFDIRATERDVFGN